MPTTTIRVSTQTRETLHKLAESAGISMHKILDNAQEIYRCQQLLEQTNSAYGAFRDNPAAWEEFERERRAWDATLGDEPGKLMHDVSLLIDVAMLLVTAFAGGLIPRRLGMPTIVGYLVAGMAIGPFTPGFVGDVHDISQLAELGVIFLMFGVGLHFSLSDLWAVRTIAIPGAIVQMLLAILCGYALAISWGWSTGASLILGLAISIASTVVLLRSLMDYGLLNTLHGQVAVGWLVLEDLATILILVLLPVLFGGEGGASWQNAALALVKAAIFVVIMLIVGAKFLPWLLMRIAFSRSRELFILAVVAVAVGTALASAQFFGVSLALGAFLAGVVLGESPISHNIGAELVPFRDLFAVVFFVSVGMLVNPLYLVTNAGHVLAITAVIVLGKAILTILMGFFLPASARTTLVVAAGKSQIGEFSFILGQSGVSLGVLSQDQYSLILAGALLSIVLNPLLFKAMPGVEEWLRRSPALWRWFDRQGNQPAVSSHDLDGHVVIVGSGRVGEHIVNVLERLNVPRLVVENDPERAQAIGERGIPILYGDAANSEIMNHAGLEQARVLVVTLPDEAAAEMVVAAARQHVPELPIIARAATRSGVQRLAQLGAEDVIHPELEGGLEVMRHTLLALNFPAGQVQHFTDAVRREQYDTALSSNLQHQLLDQLWATMRGLEITWHSLDANHPLVGQTLAEANLARATTGVYVIAIIRGQETLYNPPAQTQMLEGDLIGFMGDHAHITAMDQLLTTSSLPIN